jgi:hypothetical protein
MNRRNPQDSRGRYHGVVKGTSSGRVAQIYQYVEGGDYHVIFVNVHRDGEEQVVGSPKASYKTLAAAERKARTFVDDAPRRNAGDADWRVLDLHRMNGARKNAGQNTPGLYPISSLKKGEFFKRKPDARKVYVKGDYDRSERTYTGTDTEDISRAIYLKGTTRVYVGFDY